MPGFAAELVQAAGQALGYNPIGSQLEAMESQLRAGSEGPSGPKNEVEKYYDEQADKLAIDRSQKWSDPVGYYTKDNEIALNKRAQSNVRGCNSDYAPDQRGGRIRPVPYSGGASLYNQFVGNLVNQTTVCQVFAVAVEL
jgi:hypothetical protein